MQQVFYFTGVRRYEKESSRSDTPNTSGLSPYLHFGQISPQTVYHEAKHCKSQKFIRKLAWRDLAYWLLVLFPQMPTLPMRPAYRVNYFFYLAHGENNSVKRNLTKANGLSTLAGSTYSPHKSKQPLHRST